MTADLRRFAALVSRARFGIAEACLLIAQDAYSELDVKVELARLDAIAAVIGCRLAKGASDEQKIVALNHHLYGELGFRGNTDEYYDPRNSYLNDVLARATGIPITLAIVYLEVGRRLGLQLDGVSFPGHFLVKLTLRHSRLLLDPFNGGAPQSVEALRQRLAQIAPRGSPEGADLERVLAAATPREIIARVLRNLKSVHLQSRRFEQALAVMNRMLLVAPEQAEELRDRGLIYAQMEAWRAALADLRQYLERRPDAPDSNAMRAQVLALESACARLN